MNVYEIPVVFVIGGETEQEAVKTLSDLLVERDIVNNTTDHPSLPVDCWWMPNHDSSEYSDYKLVKMSHKAWAEHLAKKPKEKESV